MSFPPISSYGFIGNLGSCALVGLDGSIDWCCLPRLDSPSVFAAILDPDVGGRFRIRPADAGATVRQTYAGETNVLRTEFTTSTGVLLVTDWMHMGESGDEDSEEHRLPALYRSVACLSGTVEAVVDFDPRLQYASAETRTLAEPGRLVAVCGGDTVTLHADTPWSDARSARFTLQTGESRSFLLTYGRTERAAFPSPDASLRSTEAYWSRWVGECRMGSDLVLDGWRTPVIRSALALRILAGGRGIAAAATTSLPEAVGGADNWDYRFNWIRDTSFTIQALSALGHNHDAREFLGWLQDLLVTAGRRPADLKILYPLFNVDITAERELPHLRGYRDSRPVRVGNAASVQAQHDIYGEVLEAVYRSEYLQPGVDQTLGGVLRDIVHYVCDIWRLPDSGIWELRRPLEHYTYSKVMCWVALDRGIKLAERHGWEANLDRWRHERDAVRAEVMERGFSEERNAFVQSYESPLLDATALLFPLLEFLPPDHPRAIGTLEAIERELAVGPLVYRSEEHRGREGAFGLCSFWLVDALALVGRTADAERNFRALLAQANHVGLYAEEIDPHTGEFVGNYPQAFTLVGLINSALYLERARAKKPAEQPIMGEKHLPAAT